MSAYDKLCASVPVPPRRVIVLRAEHWASTFSDAPANPIQVGLRLLSIEDQEIVRQVANKAALDAAMGDLDPQIAAHNAFLVTSVARAVCSPRDARRGHDFFSAPDDVLPIALTEPALKWMFDELEKLAVECSPIFSAADDDDVSDLCEALTGGALARLEAKDAAKAARARRYIDFVLTELDAV